MEKPDKRIMVVDDEDGVRKLMTRLLTRAGYDVIAVASGAEALEAASNEDPVDLVVSDIVMPGMKGTEMARRMRERQPDLSVLFVTGYPQEDLSFRDGERVLFKPFKQQELLDEVERCLD